jgi:ABC-2 type transport system permease protein
VNALRGTAALTALAVRRDRYRLSAYVLGLAGFLGATAAMIVADTDASQRETARVFAGNAAMRMLGLSSGAAMVATRCSATTCCSRSWPR